LKAEVKEILLKAQEKEDQTESTCNLTCAVLSGMNEWDVVLSFEIYC
jgi:hypothetical protein